MAGAFVAAALSLALLALGTGVGLSSVSPWANAGANAKAISWAAIGWLVLMQLIAFSIGGYVAGRLRTRWVSVHTHEVYFRDTAHGFLVWAVGLVITAAFLTSAAASMLGGAAGAAAASAPQDSLGPTGYLVDTMLRPNPYTPDNVAIRAEVGSIVAHDLREGSLDPADRSYLAHLISTKSGLTQAEAEGRVDDAYARGLQAADAARKTVAHSMYWTFLALLVGAFFASVAATVGGRQRDNVVLV